LRFVSRSMVPCLLRLVLRRLAWVTAAGEDWYPVHLLLGHAAAAVRAP
jgi:hypothetical protein